MLQEVAYGSALYHAMTQLRDEALRRPLGLVQTAGDLEGEDRQLHFAAVEGGTVVGTVLLKPVSPTLVKLRQMAVASSMRGTRVGASLVRFAEAAARARGFQDVELNARLAVAGFYERLGYRSVGEGFLEVGLPHVRMVPPPRGKCSRTIGVSVLPAGPICRSLDPTHPGPFMSAPVLLAALLLIPGAAEAGDWTAFHNDRFGFSVDVPASFRSGARPDNNDGLAFDAPGGHAEIRAYGYLLVDEKDLAADARQTERYEVQDGVRVTYRQGTPGAFTLSGLKGDRIVYDHAVATCRGTAVAMIRAEYPLADKARFDPLLAHMVRTLRGSNACWSPG